MIHKLRLSIALVCAIVIVFVTCAQAASPSDYDDKKPGSLMPGHLRSAYGAVINADTGDILFEKDAHTRLYPAGTTRVMTCILAIEYGPVGEIVTIPEGITAPADSAALGIKPGETMPFDDLIYGMMLGGGSDAALAVAILVSGSEYAFVGLMNEKAFELGLTNTYFMNPHGYHDANHYTTAYDMALIARYAIKNDMFRQIASAHTYTLAPTNLRLTELTLLSECALQDPSSENYYAPCAGAVTGYSRASERCLVGAATLDGVTLVTAAFKAPTPDYGGRYGNVSADTTRLMEFGFHAAGIDN